MKNESVIESWIDGEQAESSNGALSTDGVDLYSYKLKIGSRRCGLNRVWDYTASGMYYSQTTSKHVGMACTIATNVFLMNPSFDGSVDKYYSSQV